MIILPHELEIFQSCPALWKLQDQFPVSIPTPSAYTVALKNTIYRMFGWQMSNNRYLAPASVRDYWDQQWWATGIRDETKNNVEVFNKAANGWILLEKFYHNIYTRKSWLPIGVNFETNWQVGNIDHRIHFDLILADRDGTIELIELGGKRSEWQMYTSLITKVQTCGFTKIFQAPPARKLHIDLVSRETNYLQKVLNLTPEYISDSMRILSSVSKALQTNNVYASWSDSCKTCPAAGKCWY